MSSVNLQLSIENDQIYINDIPVASIGYVDNSVSQIENLVSVQNNVFQSFNGVILSDHRIDNLNGVYKQLLQTKKLVVTDDTARFFNTDEHYCYLKIDGFDYYLLVYTEPITSTVFGNITSLDENGWLIIKYKQNPDTILPNINHYSLLADPPIQTLISYSTSRQGSQTFPKDTRIEFF